MAQAQFPQTPDLELSTEKRIGDGTNINLHKYSVSNPHPGHGKDPNIGNEFGHTVYPKYVGNVIVNNPMEEQQELDKQPKVDTGWETILKQDGPTVHEFVKAGYKASSYPPEGYASKSTQEEIDEAIAAESANKTSGWGK